MNKDSNEIYLLIISGIAVSAVLVSFIIYFVTKYQQNQRKNTLERMQIKMEYEKTLLQTQIEIQEQTLKNISQEIHDNIGQSLSLAKLNLNTFNISKPGQAQTKVDSSLELVSKAIHDLRNLSKSLNTDSILATGLRSAIEHELGLLERSESFETSLSIEGNPRKFDPKKELILFRIFQEAVNNIIKHAHATKVSVQLKYRDDRISLVISDNGTGFDPGENFEGTGIRNMKNRASLIGAEFVLQSGKGETTIHITIPITSA